MSETDFLNDDFFNFDELNKVDEQLREQYEKPTLVDTMQADADAAEARRFAWTNELKRFWYVYVFAAVSALFTGMLGLYMGLSPSLITAADGSQMIHFNSDTGHVILAFVYFIAFIAVTEFQFLVAKWKFHTREEGNGKQYWTMLAGMGIGLIGILATGIAGGMVVASNISFLSEFVEVPPGAQIWVVVAIPIMIGIYLALYSTYALSSREAQAERIIREKRNKHRLDHETRRNMIDEWADRQMEQAETLAYMKLVQKGKLSKAEARAAMRAGKSIGQLEKDLGRDLDDNQEIGSIGPRVRVLPASMRRPLYPGDVFSRFGKQYTLEDVLSSLDDGGIGRDQVIRLILSRPDLRDPAVAFSELSDYLPADMTADNFREIHAQLMALVQAAGPHPAPRSQRYEPDFSQPWPNEKPGPEPIPYYPSPMKPAADNPSDHPRNNGASNSFQ